MALACLAGLLVLLRTGDRPDGPPPEPEPTTTSAPVRETPTLLWAAGPGTEMTAVQDLERGHGVIQVSGGGIVRDEDVHGASRVTFTADLKVLGSGRAVSWIQAVVQNVGTGDEARPRVSVESDPVAAGGWVRRSVTIDAPDGTLIRFGAAIEGGGTLLVDPIALPE